MFKVTISKVVNLNTHSDNRLFRIYMKITMTKIWVVAGFLALIGIAQANGGSSDAVSANQVMSQTNPHLANR